MSRTWSELWQQATPIEREAQEAGAGFYHPPSLLDYQTQIDPLLQEACARVNSSDWLWTAETCQGHPDYDGVNIHTAWDHQTGPYFRVVLRDQYVGLCFALLYKAAVEEKLQDAFPLGVEFYARRLRSTWNSFPILIRAHNVKTRDRACQMLTHFAELVEREGDRIRATPNAVRPS